MDSKKITLAAGVFFPDVGGPAIHVMKIAETLSKAGFDVVVVAYGENPENENLPFRVARISRVMSKGAQWLSYFCRILVEAWKSEVIYAFDPTAAGLLAAVAALLFGKHFVIRIGGDPIWERTVEKNKRFITIEEYYKNKYEFEDAPKLFRIIRFVLKRAEKVVVYNEFFKDFYVTYFDVDPAKIFIVKNPVFKRESAAGALPPDPEIVFAGRFVSYKNLPFVIRVFDKVRQKLGRGSLTLIGDGPEKERLLALKNEIASGPHIRFIDKLPQNELFELIKKSAFSIAPALNEFNPNFILESLSFGKPVLISRGHGLSVDLSREFVFDPQNENDLEEKITALFDPDKYAMAVDKISRLDLNQTWENVTDFHKNLIEQLCKKY